MEKINTKQVKERFGWLPWAAKKDKKKEEENTDWQLLVTKEQQGGWRPWVARVALILLAASASWGVYQFSRIHVPDLVAGITAAAFEMTYIGLALQPLLTNEQYKRARRIARGAVVVSVLYNSISAFMHRVPDIKGVSDQQIEIEALLAVLHGAPLAIVAYLVADLLLHPNHTGTAAAAVVVSTGAAPAESKNVPVPVESAAPLPPTPPAPVQIQKSAPPVTPAPVTLSDLLEEVPAPVQIQHPRPAPPAASNVGRVQHPTPAPTPVQAHENKGLYLVQQQPVSAPRALEQEVIPAAEGEKLHGRDLAADLVGKIFSLPPEKANGVVDKAIEVWQASPGQLRRKELAELVKSGKPINKAELARQHKVSVACIRKDLEKIASLEESEVPA